MRGGSPLIDEFLDAVCREVQGQSRTILTGRVDTSSAPEKAEALRETSADGPEDWRVQVRSAVDYLSTVPMAGIHAQELIEVNRLLTGGISGELRPFEVGRFAYIRPSEIPENLDAFVDSMRCWPTQPPTVKRLLFEVHWSVNLRGHYFADGCGRTATVVGCWAEFQLFGSVSRLPRRQDYLSVATSRDPYECWQALPWPEA